jgi:cell wall-associated NlpC family hydrolase
MPTLVRADNPDTPRISLGCRVRIGRGPAVALPLGAGVRGEAQLVDGTVVPRPELHSLFPPDAGRVAATAVEYYAGTSYQWGGVTPWGADCSGMVQRVFALHGVALPRDAWQQALTGEDAGNDVAALRAGDLLFFTDRDDRRITHVGIALGASRIVHLALGRGGYAVDRLDDSGDEYARRLASRFVCARRHAWPTHPLGG